MSRRVNGEGSLFKRKDGRWSAQTYVTLVNGEKKRICITAKDRETVRQKLRDMQEQKDRGVPFVEKDRSIADYLDYWMKDIQMKQLRESTIISYSRLIKSYLKPTFFTQNHFHFSFSCCVRCVILNQTVCPIFISLDGLFVKYYYYIV